jgi:hypothetical protein
LSHRPRDRSIDRKRKTRRQPAEEFGARVADNLLISSDLRSEMEGIGSDFRRFGGSRTRPGRVHDASLNPLGSRLKANAALRREAFLGGELAGRSVGRENAPQGLGIFESAPGNAMASETSYPKIWYAGTRALRPRPRLGEAANAPLAPLGRRQQEPTPRERGLAWASARRRQGWLGCCAWAEAAGFCLLFSLAM